MHGIADDTKRRNGQAAFGGSKFFSAAGIETLTGGVLGMGTVALAASMQMEGSAWRVPVVVALCFGVVSIALNGVRTSRMRLMSRLSRELSGIEDCEDFTYVLYLRPFASDQRLFATRRVTVRNSPGAFLSFLGFGDPVVDSFTWEQHLVATLRRFGRVIAVGRPLEQERPPGAGRFYLPQHDWKPVVSQAIAKARMVVFVVGTRDETALAEGTLWEYSEAIRLLPPSRIALLVCGERVDYDRFREAATAACLSRTAAVGKRPLQPPVLPDYVAGRGARGRRDSPIHGIVHFPESREPEFTVFDMSSHRTEGRRRLDSALAEVERLLPGEAVKPTLVRSHLPYRWLGCGVSIALLFQTDVSMDTWTTPASWRFEFNLFTMVISLGLLLALWQSTVSHEAHIDRNLPRVLVRSDVGTDPEGARTDHERSVRASAGPSGRRGPLHLMAHPLVQGIRSAAEFALPAIIAMFLFTGLSSSNPDPLWLLLAVLLSVDMLLRVRASHLFRNTSRIPVDLRLERACVYLQPFGGEAPNADLRLPTHQLLSDLILGKGDRLWVAGGAADLPDTMNELRLPLPAEHWKSYVTCTMPLASSVALPAVDRRETVWQFTEAVRILPPSHLALILPAGQGAVREYEAFRRSVKHLLRQRHRELTCAQGRGFRPPVLPALKDRLDGDALRGLEMRGIVRFRAGWVPELVPLPLDLSAEPRQVRRQVAEAREQLTAGMPRLR